MPFDVAGNFTRSYNFQQDRDNGIKILAARVDGEFDNFATGMNAVFFRDGRVPMQADLRMNINRVTGLADGSVGSPALKFNTDASTGPYLDGLSRYAVSVNGVQRSVHTTTGLDITGTLTTTGNMTMAGNLVATQSYVAGVYAPLASPAFTGAPTAPTPISAENSTRIATTAWVQSVFMPKIGGTFTGAISTPVVNITGATGAVNIQPRDLSATWPLIYSPVSGDIRLSSGGGSDLLVANATGVSVTGVMAATGNITGGNALTLTNGSLPAVNLVKTGSFAGTAQLFNDGGAQFVAGAAGQSMHLRADTIRLRSQNTSTDFATIDSTAANFAVPILVATEAAGTSNTRAATTAFVDRLRSLSSRSDGGGSIVIGDRGGLIIMTGNPTIPNGVFAAGDVVNLYNNTAASLTITQGASLTLRLSGTATTGNRTLLQRGMATITFVSSSEAIASGDIT